MMENGTRKEKIYPFHASKDINWTSRQYLKTEFSSPTFQTNSLLNDQAPTPNRWVFLNAPESFPSTRISHFSIDSKDEKSFLCGWLQLSPDFFSLDGTVWEKLWKPGVLSQYPSLPEVAYIFSLCFDCWKVNSSKSSFSRYPHGTGQQFIFYWKLRFPAFCHWKL